MIRRWVMVSWALFLGGALLFACKGGAPSDASRQAAQQAAQKAEAPRKAVAEADDGLPKGLSDTEKADWILEKWHSIQHGGAQSAYKSIQVDGRVNFIEPALIGDIRVITQGSDKAYSRVTFPGGGRFVEEAYDKKRGWQRVTGQRVRPLTADELAARRRANLMWTDIRERYPSRRYVSMGEVEGRLAHRLELTDAEGSRQVFYLDASTFELFKVRSVPAGDGSGKSLTLMKDYRRVNGVLEPFFLRLETDEGTQEIQIYEIQYNVDVPDDLFKYPTR